MTSKKSQKISSKSGHYYDDHSETDSADSGGSDWGKEYEEKTRKLWKRSQDLAQKPGETQRNLKHERGGDGGSGKQKKGGLGKCEADGEEDEPRQCYWIFCVNAARLNSKYCSDDCGVKLAELRIKGLLYEQLSEWKATPSVAEVKNEKELEETRDKRITLRTQFDSLDEQRQALDVYIEEVSKISHDPTEDFDETGHGDDGVVACVICSHETNAKSYSKHIERCFNRTERCIAFESKMPSYLPGIRLFCDYFNEKNGSYCKRLAVNCPDHSKRPHLPKNAICGAPLSPNGDLDLTKVCKTVKSKCQRHYNWEKLRRAEIDIQKVEAWTRQDQMLRKEQDLIRQIKTRGGLLDVMLNSTKIESN